METVIGVYDGRPANFEVLKTPIYSKKKRLIGHEIVYNYLNNDVDPNVSIDTSINSITPFKDISLNLINGDRDYTIFNFGKYKGKKISECVDIDYLKWYYESYHKNIPIDILTIIKNKISSKYFEYDDRLYPIECTMSDEDNDILNNIKNNKICAFKFNLNTYGKYHAINGVIIEFPKFRSASFSGINYGMPEISENHFIKLKNKTIKINNCDIKFNESINRWLITIHDFEIIKKESTEKVDS